VPPVKGRQEIKPFALTSSTNGVFIFDLGQNIAGVARLKVKGPEGTRITLRYGERLHPDGRLMTENLRNARATDDYILRGHPAGETYIPRFTYHGFQYVEVSGYPGKPDLDSVSGVVMHSDIPLSGGFACSDPMVSRLHTNIVWTQRANFLEVPTDCPQRDERLGWMGDGQLFAGSAIYNADLAAFYSKWLREIIEAQRPSGAFSSYAPFPYQHEWDFASGWSDGGVIIPWTLYRAYGDTNIIARCWEAVTRFLEWRKTEGKDFLGVAHGTDWGDWLALKEVTPLEFIDTVYFARDSKCMAEMASAVGKTPGAAEYQKLFENIRTAFQRKYVKADGTLTMETQTAYAIAIMADLLPKDSQAGKRLADRVMANGGRLATGLLGTKDLLPALSDSGQNDLAVRLLQSRDFPSWGYQIEQGATTVWERWDSFVDGKGYGERTAAPMNSFSHPCLGSVCEWMFSRLAGIRSGEAGWKKIVIWPCPPSPDSNPKEKAISWVRAHYDSIRGRIETAWKRSENDFELDVTIPPNTTATVYLPARDSDGVREGDNPLATAKGVKFIRMESGRAVLAVESGSYRFKAAL